MAGVDMFGITMLFISLILVIQSIVGSYFAYKKIRIFHESGVAIILGMIFSAIAKFGFNYTTKLDKRIFLYGFLPMIVFAEGFTLKKRHFFKKMGPILLFGMIGTILTMGITSALIQVVTDKGLVRMQVSGNNNKDNNDDGNNNFSSNHKNANIKSNKNNLVQDGDDIQKNEEIYFYPKEILLFASAVSVKDSFIASTMVDHHLFPGIFNVIFGEGIVNDATSILLFDSFESFVDEEKSLQWNILPQIIGKFMQTLTVSVTIGVSFGILCSLILKHFYFLQNTIVHEALIIFFCSFSSYSIVEALHYSGVVSLLFCGIISGHFAFYNLSEKGMICSSNAFQIISSGAENCLFAYLGFTTFNLFNRSWSFSFIGFILLFILVSRFFSVFVMSFIMKMILKCFGKKWEISFKDQIVLVLTGMSRGVLGYVLVQRINGGSDEYSNFQEVLISTMVSVIILTTLFFGFAFPKIIDYTLHSQKRKNSAFLHNSDQVENCHASGEINQNHNKINTQEDQNSNNSNEKKEQDQVKKSLKDFLLNKQEIDTQLINKKLSYKIQKFYILKVKPFLIRDYFNRYLILQQCKKYLKNDKFDIRRPESQTLDQQLLRHSLEIKINSIKSNSINSNHNKNNNDNNNFVFDVDVECQNNNNNSNNNINSLIAKKNSIKNGSGSINNNEIEIENNINNKNNSSINRNSMKQIETKSDCSQEFIIKEFQNQSNSMKDIKEKSN